MTFDAARASRAFNGHDPRQWVSYATVDPETPDQPSVRFKGDDGKPLPYGPLVNVTLQPSGIALPARVMGAVAGDGEAEYYPFVAGDEVVVLLPEGDERAGAMIIGRMNQELDAWPLAVAGQDSTLNKFGFRRMRAPFIVETSAAYLIRSATTGAQIGLDPLGQVIINDGDQGMMVLGAEAMGFTAGDGESFVNVFPPSKEVFMGAGAASFLLNATESKFISEGAISFATNGAASNQTAVTAEQVAAVLINLVCALAAAAAFNPLFVPTPPTIGAIVASALSALGGASPTTVVPGGNFAAYVGTVFGPGGALAAAAANPFAPVDATGLIPGFGRPGFKL